MFRMFGCATVELKFRMLCPETIVWPLASVMYAAHVKRFLRGEMF